MDITFWTNVVEVVHVCVATPFANGRSNTVWRTTFWRTKTCRAHYILKPKTTGHGPFVCLNSVMRLTMPNMASGLIRLRAREARWDKEKEKAPVGGRLIASQQHSIHLLATYSLSPWPLSLTANSVLFENIYNTRKNCCNFVVLISLIERTKLSVANIFFTSATNKSRITALKPNIYIGDSHAATVETMRSILCMWNII